MTNEELIERLLEGTQRCGMHEDNETELFDILGADETMHAAANTIERLTTQLAEARQAERAAVVAFVREQASNADARLSECTRDLSAQHFATAYVTCSRLIAAIEAGEHLA